METKWKEAAAAWDAWIASDKGKTCVDRATLTPGPYLRNRLWRAFMDGYNAALRSSQGGREGDEGEGCG